MNRSIDETQYVTFVPPLPFDEADRTFRRRLAEQGLSLAKLSDEDVLVDVIRAPDGHSLRRYRIRQALLHASQPVGVAPHTAEEVR
ncbi:MAG: hypothetical protein HY332_10740 [Chloroflexi bacterium]|nr:hypothetical protein [Chloroflexota bacterium]